MVRGKGGRARYILPLILLLVALVWIRAIRPGHHWGGDFVIYISQAMNLLEGRPFFSTTYVVTPQSILNHPSAYPPVPSLLLAPAYSAFGLNYPALKLYLAFFAWISLIFWYRIGCRLGLPPPMSAVAVLIFGWGSLLYPVLDSVGSDGVGLLTSASALLAILWIEQERWDERRPILSACLVSLLLLLCAATRSTSLALIGAFGLHQAHQALRRRTLGLYAVAALALTAIGLVLYQTLLYNNTQQYGTQFTLNGPLILRDAIFYLRAGAPLWSFAPTPLRYLLAGSMLVAALGALFRRRWGVVEWYVVVFYVMLCLYTGSNDFRYILPVLPVLLFLAADSLLALGRWRFPSQAPAWTLGALAVMASLFNLVGMETGRIPEGIEKPGFEEVVGYLRSTPSDTLVLSWNPRLFGFYTERPSALYPQQVESFNSQIPPTDGSILLVHYEHPLDHEKLDSYLTTGPEKPPAVFVGENFTVYRIR